MPVQQRNIGFVFQNYALWPHFSTYKNISLGMENDQKLSATEIKAQVEKLTELLGISNLIHRYPHELSGGQQQRVALARALAKNPKIVLLDEPLSNIDQKLKEEILDQLKRIHKELKTTFIYVTHDQNEALNAGTDMAIMNYGKIEQTGTPLEVYENPHSAFAANFLGSTNILEGTCQTDNGETILESNGYIYNLGDQRNLPDKGKIKLSLRPELIRITSQENSMRAVIKEIKFIDGNLKTKLGLSNGHSLVALIPLENNQKLEVGCQIGFKLLDHQFIPLN